MSDEMYCPEAGDQLFTCVDCHCSVVFKAGEKAFYRDHDITPPKRCKACREQRKQHMSQVIQEDDSPVAETRLCVDCGTSFNVTEHERDWFKDKGFVLPSRCRPCRARRRADRDAVATHARVWKD